MAQHAGLLGRHNPIIPEHELKLLNQPPKIHHQTKERNKWQEEKQLA